MTDINKAPSWELGATTTEALVGPSLSFPILHPSTRPVKKLIAPATRCATFRYAGIGCCSGQQRGVR
jgi:hypothetical protein